MARMSLVHKMGGLASCSLPILDLEEYIMAEFTAIDLQEVAENQNVLFTETPICAIKGILHREGSGIVRVSGNGAQGRARYLVGFSGNIQIPTGGTVGEISVAIAIDGEPLASTQMIVNPAAVESLFNVSAQAYIDVPCGCCATIAVQNTSDQAIEVQNANLIVVRVA